MRLVLKLISVLNHNLWFIHNKTGFSESRSKCCKSTVPHLQEREWWSMWAQSFAQADVCQVQSWMGSNTPTLTNWRGPPTCPSPDIIMIADNWQVGDSTHLSMLARRHGRKSFSLPGHEGPPPRLIWLRTWHLNWINVINKEWQEAHCV